MPKSIDLDHVGPIEHLRIPIPDEGGVVVLRGSNGSGKSHGLNAVEALYSKGSRRQLRSSDGVQKGTIKGLGVVVRLGRTNTAKGELVCESLDGRVDPSLLVDPGIKDPEKADSKRLATLIRLGGITIPIETWSSALTDVVEHLPLKALVDDDPVVTAGKIRRRLHEVALQRERLAESKANEATTLAKTIDEIDFEQEHRADVLSARLDEASVDLASAKMQQEERLQAVARQAAAKEQLDALELPDIEVLSTELTTRQEEANSCFENEVAIERKLAELQRELSEVRAAKSLADERAHTASTALDQAMSQAEQIAELKAVIESNPVEPITDERIAQLDKQKSEALEAVQLGEVVRRAIDTKEQVDQLQTDANAITSESTTLRTQAKSTDAVLEQALIDAGFDTIKVHDGRLCVSSDRGLEPFSDLSHGERWRMALDLAAHGLPKSSVLPVCQEAFESLDPTNRSEINELARERGLVIVTAEATDGDLRAEVLEAQN